MFLTPERWAELEFEFDLHRDDPTAAWCPSVLYLPNGYHQKHFLLASLIHPSGPGYSPGTCLALF